MDSFFAFSLHCLRAPINELACGPFWLVVSFVAFGAGATTVVLLVQSYLDWCRRRAWRIAHGREAKDDLELLNDPDFVDAARDVVRPRTDNRNSSSI